MATAAARLDNDAARLQRDADAAVRRLALPELREGFSGEPLAVLLRTESGYRGYFAAERTTELPMVDFREPEKLIGSNTVGSITSGLYYGFVGMIDGLAERIIAELGPETKTVATGGQGEAITKASRFVKVYDEDLTLDGLRLIWERAQ